MLKQRSISAIGIVLVAAVPAFVGGALFAAAMIALAVLGIAELLRAFGVTGARPFRSVALAGGLAIPGAVALRLSPSVVTGLIVATVLVSLAAALMRSQPIPMLTDWALTVAGTLYVALPLALAIALRGLDGDATQGWVNTLVQRLGSGGTGLGLAWFGLALAVTWLTDTGAYLVGRQFGTTKLIPSVSPGKTRVGAVAGVVTGTLAAVAAAALFGVPIPWYIAAGVGIVLSILGQIGDLCESLLKRSIGIKDMGHLIPGHGGILDRIDALLLTLPAAYYLARLIEEVHLS